MKEGSCQGAALPPCEVCQKAAEWQIGAYRPFSKHLPLFYCWEHLPKFAQEKVKAGEYADRSK